MESANLPNDDLEISRVLIESPLTYQDISSENKNFTNNRNLTKTSYEQVPEISEKDAINLLQLLEDWGFRFLYKLFLAERIDIEALKTLSRHHLLNLCASGKLKLGIAIKLELKLIEWQETREKPEEGIISVSKELIANNSIKKNVCLTRILEDSPKGRLITKYFKSTNKLNDACRTSILEIINNFLIQNEIKMSTDLSRDISHQIIRQFPTEDLDMYYIKQHGQPTISKVSAKYYNAQRSLKSCGILGKRSYESRLSKEAKFRNEQILNIVPEENNDESLCEISNDNCSFAELEYHWCATKNYRARDIASLETNCTEIINKWPHYRKPLGYKLIEIDFQNLFQSASNLVDNFETFYMKVLPIFKDKIKDSHNKKIMENLLKDNCISENGKHTSTLYLLHCLIPPVSKEVSSSSRQYIKYSTKDSQNSVFVFGETATEAEEIINKKLAQNLPVQPFVVVIGTIEEPKDFIVYFDAIRYKMPTVLNAIDCCFKIYNFFNLQYPNQSLLFWNFIQHYMYKITTTFDKYHTSISALVKKLND